MAKTCLIVMIHGFVKTSRTKNDLRSKKHDQSSRSVAASLARTSTANLKEWLIKDFNMQMVDGNLNS